MGLPPERRMTGNVIFVKRDLLGRTDIYWAAASLGKKEKENWGRKSQGTLTGFARRSKKKKNFSGMFLVKGRKKRESM